MKWYWIKDSVCVIIYRRGDHLLFMIKKMALCPSGRFPSPIRLQMSNGEAKFKSHSTFLELTMIQKHSLFPMDKLTQLLKPSARTLPIVASFSSFTCDCLLSSPCCELGLINYSKHRHTRTEIFLIHWKYSLICLSYQM